MSSLSMSQAVGLRGLRGLGVAAGAVAVKAPPPPPPPPLPPAKHFAATGDKSTSSSPTTGSLAENLKRKPATLSTSAPLERDIPTRYNTETGEPLREAASSTIDQRTTNLSFAPMPQRPGRVSPLSVSWGMPLQLQPIESRTRFGGQGLSATKLAMIAGGVVFGGLVLYMIFGSRGDE